MENAGPSINSGELTSGNAKVAYMLLGEVERLDQYRPGGLHPITAGDRLLNRYTIVYKLGHGDYSTTWLARDQ